MRHVSRLLLVVVSLSVCAVAGGDLPSPLDGGLSIPAKASVPFTYCIDYRMKFTDKYFAEIRQSPPDLFHVGHIVVFRGVTGPTRLGEKGLYTNALVPPTEVASEVEKVKDMIRRMRATGTANVLPYVCTIVLFGNPRTRTGFFNFYDLWDDYAAYGLGPKPSDDPLLWSQERGPEHKTLPTGEEYWDVMACINNPGWGSFLRTYARQVGQLGYEGLFFDVNDLYCYCPDCEKAFDRYLLSKYGLDGLKDTFGTDDLRKLNLPTIYRDFEKFILESFRKYQPSEVPLEDDWRLLRCYMQGSLGEFPTSPLDQYLMERFGTIHPASVPPKQRDAYVQCALRESFHSYLESPELAALLEERFGSSDIRRRCCGTPRDLLLWVENQRFWQQSMARMFEEMKEAGEQGRVEAGLTKRFFTISNDGPLSTIDCTNKRRVCSIDPQAYAAHVDLQMAEEMNQPGMLDCGVIVNNMFGFEWAQACGSKLGTLLYKANTDGAADLAIAEAAAGGGGAFIHPGITGPKARARWKDFFHSLPQLWEGCESYAKVGIVFLSDQNCYEHVDHQRMVHRLVRVFSETQVPFDLVSVLQKDVLARYDVLIVPELRYVSDEQIEVLREYAESGKKLILVGAFAECNEKAGAREARPFEALSKSGKVWLVPAGKVPERRSDLFNLMEERNNALPLAAAFAKRERAAELAEGRDLGPRFVEELEGVLGERLTWAAVPLDPGMYVNPFVHYGGGNGPDRIVLHLVNYHIPIKYRSNPDWSADEATWKTKTRSGTAKRRQPITLRVPVPSSKKIVIKSFSPTDHVSPVKWKTRGDELILTVNGLEVYQAIEIHLAPS
ncbi:MAG: beta-galactosidase trimerization domain-containing protein [Candidatus Hydrogenedentes bacterium]|nr:beta-galactosidase trimerization domain-containing protein [Candidatus Hydrogenedentota bacterium]